MSTTKRTLHFVLKVGSLKKNIEFFRDMFDMKVLRHEVFDEGCQAACNGPYDNKWSKTMIGYGPEDDNFVFELTYNYSIGSYQVGNDLDCFRISVTKETYDKLRPMRVEDKYSSISADEYNENYYAILVTSPDGYKIKVEGRDNFSPRIYQIDYNISNLNRSLEFWMGLLKMNRYDDSKWNDDIAYLGYVDNVQAAICLHVRRHELDHKSAYGRLAISCPADELKSLQKSAEDAGYKVLTPYISLDTPGKATVQVVILADPDGHEVCLVGDEGFRQLSQVDPKANELVEKSIEEEEKSDKWFQDKRKHKQEA